MSGFGAADRSSSNMAGVTRMNKQEGAAGRRETHGTGAARGGKAGLSSPGLPSMSRVDGENKVDFDYEELAEALGWDDFGNDDFEEIMSTHYGRMVVLDDRVLLFANPEDAAEYIGFALQPVQ